MKRKPFQGASNIIRFNWHYYILGFAFVLFLFLSVVLFPQLKIVSTSISVLIILSISISLLTSYYIYDLSNLYSFDWLKKIEIKSDEHIVNINAGFDETSAILSQKFPQSKLRVLDFYDPAKHTEISIERARRAYPALCGNGNNKY